MLGGAPEAHEVLSEVPRREECEAERVSVVPGRFRYGRLGGFSHGCEYFGEPIRRRFVEDNRSIAETPLLIWYRSQSVAVLKNRPFETSGMERKGPKLRIRHGQVTEPGKKIPFLALRGEMGF